MGSEESRELEASSTVPESGLVTSLSEPSVSDTLSGGNYSPPPPSINVIEIEDMNPTKIAPDKAMPVDVVLIVVNENEFRTVYEILSEPKVADFGSLVNVYFGTIGRNWVALVRSQPGSDLEGASRETCSDAINKLKPKAVIGVGVCFGMKKEKHKLADVLVSKMLATYGQIRNSGDVPEDRGVKLQCDVRLVKLFSNMVGWKCPREDKYKAKVYSGLIISGEEVVDKKDRLEALKKRYPGALGGEMEGQGIYTACKKAVPWIICKSICDWADGTKDDRWQLYAAAVAASFVKHVLTQNYIAGHIELPKRTRKRQDIDYNKLNNLSSVDLYPDVRQKKRIKRSGVFKVERIISRRAVKGNEDEYLIKWDRYPLETSSWEAASKLPDLLIRNYENPPKPSIHRLEDASRQFFTAIQASIKSRSVAPGCKYINIDHDIWRYISRGKGVESERRGWRSYSIEDFTSLPLPNNWWYFINTSDGQGQKVKPPLEIKPILSWTSPSQKVEGGKLIKAPRMPLEKLCMDILRSPCDANNLFD